MIDGGVPFPLEGKSLALVLFLVAQVFATGVWVARDESRLGVIEHSEQEQGAAIARLDVARENFGIRLTQIDDKLDEVIRLLKAAAIPPTLPR